MLMTAEPFHQGYWLVPLLVIGPVMVGQNIIYGGVLLGEGRTKVQGIATVVGSVVSVSLNLLLVPLFGVYAAAVVFAISYILMNSFLFNRMTFPEKTMVREILLVTLIPVVSYTVLLISNQGILLSVVIKLFALSMYFIIAIRLLHIKMETVIMFIKR